MFTKSVLSAAFALIVSSTPAFAVLITDFGTGSFTVDSGTTSFPTVNQSISSINVIGTDGGQILAGTFATVDISGQNTIVLTASVAATNPNSLFSVELYDPTFTNIRTYSGSFAPFGTGVSNSVVLTFQSETASFTELGGFQFTGGGVGAPLNVTLQSITAIPEPNTWILIGIGLASIVFLRRRRTA